MGLGIASIQCLLQIYSEKKFKDKKKIFALGSLELHCKKKDLYEIFEQTDLSVSLLDNFKNLDNFPNQPRCSAKYLWEALGFTEYVSLDTNGDHNSIMHDLNKPFNDRKYFNYFDVVADYGTAEHIFNISEVYNTLHKILKPDGILILSQGRLKTNGYFLLDRSFFEGIAAANKYKILGSNYIVHLRDKTPSGSYKQFRIPCSNDFFEILDFRLIDSVSIEMILQKTGNEDFKIPYQDDLMKHKYNHLGFNKIFSHDDMSYSYIPQFNNKIEKFTFKVLLKEFFKRLKNKFLKK